MPCTLCAIATAIAAMVAAGFLHAHDPAPATPPSDAELAAASAEMARAAENLWKSLSPEQQAAAGMAFDDAERFNFHFVPRPRKGIHFGQMSQTQRLLAHALLASGLSRRGYTDTTTIMSLEEVLSGIEQGRGPKREPELYYFTIFGTPGERGTWGWRAEGHHVSLNFTIVNGRGIAAAPAFLGANPFDIGEGPRKGLRTLGAEQDLAFRFLETLSDEQKKAAILSGQAPRGILSGADRKADIGEPKGITFDDLQPMQQAVLRSLIDVYAHRLREELAHQDLASINQTGWDKVHFAWAGGTERSAGHYYRIHGPTFLIEYDNTQNGANHVHTVWRDLKNDFGEDLLKRHYEQEHGESADE